MQMPPNCPPRPAGSATGNKLFVFFLPFLRTKDLCSLPTTKDALEQIQEMEEEIKEMEERIKQAKEKGEQVGEYERECEVEWK